MRKILVWTVLLVFTATVIAFAAGGSSYSGGSKAGGGSSSSGSRPSGGSSYSGGSKASGGSSYSGGSKGSSPSYSGGSKGSGGSSYSGGSKASGSKAGGSAKGSGGSYSGGSGSHSGSTDSKRPSSSSYNSPMSDAAKVEQSKRSYQASKGTYTNAAGKAVEFDKSSNSAQRVKDLPKEKIQDHSERVKSFYGPPPTNYAPAQYSDPFGPFFYLWLFEKASANDRAQWAYNHRSEMDDERWKDMCAKDKKLEARVKQLEAEQKEKDPNYVPTGLEDSDLMYDTDFVQAAATPEHGFGYYFLWFCFWVFVVAIVVGILYFLIFVKDWHYRM